MKPAEFMEPAEPLEPVKRVTCGTGRSDGSLEPTEPVEPSLSWTELMHMYFMFTISSIRM